MSEERSVHELLCALVLGEASAEERARVEAALASDPTLRAEKARIEATIGLVRDTLSADEVLSPAAQDELFARAARPPRPLWSRPAFRIAAAVALLVGGALAARGLFLSPPSPASRPDVARNDGDARGRLGGAKERIAKLEAERLGLNRPLDAAGLEKRRDVAEPPTSIESLGYVEEKRAEGARDAQSSAKSTSANAGAAPTDERTAGALRNLGYLGEASEGSKTLDRSKAEFRDDLAAIGYAGGRDGSGVTKAQEPATTITVTGSGGGGKYGQRGIGGTRRAGGESSGNEAGRQGDLFAKGEGATEGGAPNAAAGAPPQRPLPANPLTTRGFEHSGEVPTVQDFELQGHRVWNIETAKGSEFSPASPSSGDAALPTGLTGPAGPAGPTRGGGAAPLLQAPRSNSEADSSSYFLGSNELSADQKEELPHAAKNEAATQQLFLAFANGRDDVVQRLRNELERRRDVPLSDMLLYECKRRPNETPSAMFFRFWGDNPFEYPIADPLSTFSVDVDTASYALARKYLERGVVPPKEAVRTEEFVNYFAPDVPAPLEGDFAIHTDLAPSRFGGGDPNRWMLRVVVRGREVTKEARQPLSLTFVVDTSGSMQQENRLELVKHALRLLVAELDTNDSIAIVAFSTDARVILPMTSVASRSVIEVALNGLQPSGSTNAEAGLKLGYAIAADALHGNAANRVVLLSDGVANVGVTDQDRIGRDVAEQRKRGIYLNTIGVGMGNHDDVFLEQLANKGDGLCNYVDSEREARRAIVDNFTSAFQAIARDVKVQVEFDPQQVESYRLLGYENRAIADRDFRNDAVDAGEVGAGHQVTALYELVRVPSGGEEDHGALATVRLRWKPPHGAQAEEPERATEIAHPVLARQASGSFDGTPVGYRRAVFVAQFAEFLRRSVHARGDSLDELVAEVLRLEPEVGGAAFSEFADLVAKSRDLVLRTLPSNDELLRSIDALREREILLSRYEELLREDEGRRDAETLELLRRLEDENRVLEDRIRDLIRQRLGGGEARREGDLRNLGYLGDDER